MSEPARVPVGSRSVSRATTILMALAAEPRNPLGASELSRRVQVPKATVLNICAELTRASLLRRTPSGYLLGMRLAELGKAYLTSVEEIEEFYRACREDLGSVPQTVQLAVLGDGATVVYLGRYDGLEQLHLGLVSEIGRSVPAQCTAAGKSLLSALDRGQLLDRLGKGPLRGLTERSITKIRQIEKELVDIRERGYATECDEAVPGLRCFGMYLETPHRDDRLIAVSFTFRKAGFEEDRADQIVGELRRFVARFAVRIGGGVLTSPPSHGALAADGK